MVLVSSNPLATTLQFQTPGGLVVPGVSFAEVAEQTAPTGRLIRQAMSFNGLLGPSRQLAIDVQALKATVRRHFGWEEFVLRLSRTLADLRQSGPDAVARRALTEAALADTWPAEIVNLAALLGYLTSAARVPLAVSEQGLLALVVDALARPWDSVPNPLPQMSAYRRFARCAMLASELLDNRDPRDGVLTLFAPDALLGLGRIREFDLPQCALVRATELYVELLPPLFPDADRLFACKRGMPIAEWIHATVALATMAFENLKPGSSFSTRIDFTRPDDRPAAQRARRVAEELSRSRDQFREEFARLFEQAVNPGLAFRPLRESPLLRLDKDLYISLHADFLLAAADEGVFFSILDALGPAGASKGAVFAALGTAFEQYVARVLFRCAAAASTQGVRIREVPGRNRCDFAWRIGDDLLLIDAKRFGLASNLLMGDIALSQRMLTDVGKAVEQFAETAADIARDGMAAVIPEFAGWSPQRVFAAAVSHRPMYLWFGAADQIASNTKLPQPWKELFAARLLVWSISELEMLEAVLPTLPLKRLFDDVCQDDPRTFLDIRAYLQEIGWKGPSASAYYPQRARQILENED